MTIDWPTIPAEWPAPYRAQRYWGNADFYPTPELPLQEFKVWFRPPRWMQKPRGRIAVVTQAESAGDAVVIAMSSGLYTMEDTGSAGNSSWVYDNVEPA